MCVLHRFAHLHEEGEPRARGKAISVAVLGDRDTAHVLHDEVRPSLRGLACVEDLGDERMIHQGEGLTLGLEASHDLPGIQASLDDLHRDVAADGRGLLGEPHLPHAPLPESLEQTIGTQHATGLPGRHRGLGGGVILRRVSCLVLSIGHLYLCSLPGEACLCRSTPSVNPATHAPWPS
jgi:hypothetical protein